MKLLKKINNSVPKSI